MRSMLGLLLMILCVLPSRAQDDSITFDLSEIRKRPTTIGGYLEARPGIFATDRNAPFYIIRHFGHDPKSPMAQVGSVLQLDLKHQVGGTTLFARTNSNLSHTYTGWATDTRLYETYASFRPTQKLTLDCGKKALRWGKGYAWNPAAFLDRPKDPEDPELALEGVTFIGGEYTAASGGTLKALTVTPLILPVLSGLNDRIGAAGRPVYALKLYGLVADTDVDLIAVAGGGRGARYGADFSRNINPSFEVHGEWGRDTRAARRIVDASGNVRMIESSTDSYLLGVRFITPQEITVIAEYYRNGTGYSPEQMRDFYDYTAASYAEYVSSGNASTMDRVAALAEGSYGRPNAGRSYLYVRASRPDAFGVMQLTPAAMLTMNLDDGSFALTQEATYKPEGRVELRGQLSFISGVRSSDFGAKANDLRADIRVRWYL